MSKVTVTVKRIAMYPNAKNTGYNLQIFINEKIEGFVQDPQTKSFVVKQDKEYFSIDRGLFLESICALNTPHATTFADYRYSRDCGLTAGMLNGAFRGATLVIDNTCRAAGEIGDDGYVYEHDKYDVRILDVVFPKEKLEILKEEYRLALRGC